MKHYTVYQITYNEDKNIHHYLDRYGHEILSAFKSDGCSTKTALERMRAAYGTVAVNRWISRHHIIISTRVSTTTVKEVPYYA